MEIDHQTLRQIIKEELDNVLNEQKQKILSGEEFESLSAEQQLKYGRSIGWRTGVSGNRVIVGAKDYRIQGKKHPVKYTKEQFMAVKFAKTDAENELEGALSGDLSKIPSWLPWLKELINSGQVTKDNLIGAGGDLIRQKWIENADMSYFNSFVYVHGAKDASRLKAIVDGGMNTGSDISTIGYPSSGVQKYTWGNAGLILEGKVVQAFGSDGNTDNFIGGSAGLGARSSSDVNVKYTGKPGALITNRENHSKHDKFPAINEAILNDWKVVGIIVQDPDGFNSREDLLEQNKAILQDLMTKYKLFDKNFKEVKTLEEAGIK